MEIVYSEVSVKLNYVSMQRKPPPLSVELSKGFIMIIKYQSDKCLILNMLYELFTATEVKVTDRNG
jgi:hypothetical protein